MTNIFEQEPKSHVSIKHYFDFQKNNVYAIDHLLNRSPAS